MEKYILKSMTDFVLEINKEFENPTKIFDKNKQFERILNYATFLKQPLMLGMFVPCDLGGNILEEPIYSTNHSDDCYCTECENETKRCSDEQQQYRQAKERVLFEDMKIIRNSHNFFIIEPTKGTIFYRILKNNTTSTIEDLFKLRIDIMLTKSAQKQIGL